MSRGRIGPFYLSPRDASEASVLVDQGGRVLGLSPAFEALSGWLEQELLGRPWHQLLAAHLDDDDALQWLETAPSILVGHLAGPYRFRCRDGGFFQGEATVFPLRGEHGEIACCLIVISDRSDRAPHGNEGLSILDVIDPAQRRAAESDSLERFAQIASHDLQEPLRRIITYCDILKEDHGSELSEEASEIAGIIQSGGRRLRLMINDLLAYARVREQLDRAFEPVDMSAVLCHATDEMHGEIAARGVRVESAHLPLVWGRAPLFKTVFRHLLNNAIKYSGERSPLIDISVDDAGDVWQFAVTDRGVGVEARFADRIFEIFQRLHDKDEREGSGAGLAICRLIIERCGGEIWLDRSYDRGARFLFTLPKTKPDAFERVSRMPPPPGGSDLHQS